MTSNTIEAPFTLSTSERTYIEDMIAGLSQYESRMTQVNVFFKEDDGNTPNGILSEIRIRVPGNDLFAASTHEDSTKAFSNAYDAVKRQLKKRRDKLNDHQSEIRDLNEIVNNTFEPVKR